MGIRVAASRIAVPTPIRIPAASTIPGTAREPESLLAIPLVAGDQRLGVLDVWRDGLDAFTEEDLERCALLGFVTAAAWGNAQMYGELERRALTDALTGLFNIRWWRDMGPRVMAQSLRTGAGVGILLMDLDHFKQVNDSAGHAAGDSVLRAVARAIRRVVRDSDYAVRYGGEEFLIVLTNSTVDGAMRVAQALQAAIAELRPPTSDDQAGHGVDRRGRVPRSRRRSSTMSSRRRTSPCTRPSETAGIGLPWLPISRRELAGDEPSRRRVQASFSPEGARPSASLNFTRPPTRSTELR